jgi:hypothetical protein
MPGRPANQRIPIKPRTQSPEPWASKHSAVHRARTGSSRSEAHAWTEAPATSDSCGASGIGGASAPCRLCGSIAERCDSLGLLALSDDGVCLVPGVSYDVSLARPGPDIAAVYALLVSSAPAGDLPGGHPFGGERVPWPSVALASHAADGPAGRTPDVPRFPGTSPCLMSVNSRR